MIESATDYKFFPVKGIFGPSKKKGIYVYKDGTVKVYKCCGTSNYKIATCEFNIKDLSYIRHYADYKFRFYVVAYSFSFVNSIIFEDANHKVLASIPVGVMKKDTTADLIKYLKSLKSDIELDEAVNQLYTEGSWSLMFKRFMKAFMRSMWPWFVVLVLIMLLLTFAAR